MKRPEAPTRTKREVGLNADEASTKKYPYIVEFLSATKWDDGGARTPGTLTLFIEDGIWKACLNDRDGEASLYVTGATMGDCLSSIEKRASNPQGADWRAWKGKRKK